MWFVRLLFLHARWCLTHRVIQKWVWCKDSHLSALVLLLFSTRLHQLNYNSPHADSCVSVCTQDVFTALTFEGWFTSLQTFLFQRHTHTNTHARGQRAEDMLGKKTGWWSNWFNRGRMMFVQRSCPRNLFHILNPDSTSAELWMWGWWIFQKWAGSCHRTILFP